MTDAPVLRSITFDEARIVTSMVQMIAGNARNHSQPFSLRQILQLSGAIKREKFRAEQFARPVFEFIQRLVAIGILVELPFHAEDLLERQYRPGVKWTDGEWATVQAAADALGIPYVAHTYSDVAVAVSTIAADGTPGMGSGVVLANNLVVTNCHVVQGAEKVSVSWKGGTQIEAKAFKLHPNPAIDLAVISVEGFAAYPSVWIRAPRIAEPAVVLGHPFVPKVESRPLLTFTGTVSTTDQVKTYWGEEQAILCAVMPPGASGGPIFGQDGQLIGIVVEQLYGESLVADRNLALLSIFHAFIPGDILLRELQGMHPAFQMKNGFFSVDEAKALEDAFPDKWWEVST